MKYLYYVVYSYQAATSNGTGSIMHVSNEKIKSLDKIKELRESIKDIVSNEIGQTIISIIITNFILMDEVSE